MNHIITNIKLILLTSSCFVWTPEGLFYIEWQQDCFKSRLTVKEQAI